MSDTVIDGLAPRMSSGVFGQQTVDKQTLEAAWVFISS